MVILYVSLLITETTFNRKMVVAILFLLALVDISVSLDSSVDPGGWNSYFAEHSDNIDAVDVVDPSGWNYNRGTKGPEGNKIDQVQQVSMFCQRILEKGSTETNSMIEDAISTAVKAKVAQIFNKKEDINDNVGFIRRFISILLSTADLTKQNLEEGSVDVSGIIEIKVSPEHLKILTDFISSEANVSLRELDSILSTSIHRKYISTFSVSESIENIFFYIRQKEIWLPFVLMCIMLFVSRLLLSCNTTTRFCTSFLFFIFTMSYIVEYYKLYKEVEIQQRIILDKHSEIPSACNPSSQQWWSHLLKSLAFIKNEKQECMEYHKALLLDPLVEVSPSRVLSNIIADFILSPSSKIGISIAAFASGVLDGLPFWYGWLVLAVSSLFFFFLIALAVVIFLGGRIQLFGPFSGVNISSHRPSQETLPPASPAQTLPPAAPTPVTRSSSHPVLEAVSGMSKFVLMDADSLGTLVLRAQTSITAVHSGVEELNRPSVESSLPSKPSNENSNKPQQRITGKEELDIKPSSEKQINCEDIASVMEKKSELRSQDEAHGIIEESETDLASSVLEDTMESKSHCLSIKKHPENAKIVN